MKIYVVMISPDKPIMQQVEMQALAFEVWFDEDGAHDRVEQLTRYETTRKVEIVDRRHYWVDETPLRITDE